MVRVYTLTLTAAKEKYASAIVIDTVATTHTAWVSFWGTDSTADPSVTGYILRVNIPTGNPTKQNFQNMPAGFSFPSALVIDTTVASMLIGFYTIPGKCYE